MKSMFDKLNLRPQERRLVIFVGIVVFIALNAVFVYPMFGDFGKTQNERRKAEQDLRRYNDEIGRKQRYLRELRQLEESGSYIGQEDQALQLQRDVQTQAAISGVNVLKYDPTPRQTSSKTNVFFDESSLVINVNTGEKELIDFLYNLGTRSSMIRVRSMTLGPDPTRLKLQGNMTLIASFQRKPPARAAAASAASSAPKPANTPAKTAPPPPAPAKAGDAKSDSKPTPPAKK